VSVVGCHRATRCSVAAAPGQNIDRVPSACKVGLAGRSEVRERLEPVGDSLGRELAELINAHLHPLPRTLNDSAQAVT
jgi:hypothetical protein